MSASEIQVRYVPDRARFEARVAGGDEVAVLDAQPRRDVSCGRTANPPFYLSHRSG